MAHGSMVKRLHHNAIDADILLSCNRNERVLIPRLVLTPSDIDLPFVLRHWQFPKHLAWAMTINKAHGQTFKKVGIHLDESVFTHGQLYVAFSRANHFQTFAWKSFQHYIKEDMMTWTMYNFVFKELL